MKFWLLTAFVLVAGCQSSSQGANGDEPQTTKTDSESFRQPAKDGTYSDSENGFRIQFPVGWRTENRASETVVAAISPLEGVNDDFTENIAISVERGVSAKSTEEQMKATSLSLIQTGSLVEPSGTGQIPTRAGLASYLEGKRIGPSGKISLLVAVVVVDGDAWTFVCSAKPTTYKKFLPKFRSSIESFRVRP